MKNRKASGIDNILMESWTYGGKVLHIRLVQLLNDIWAQGKIPNEWKSALIISIHKKETEGLFKLQKNIIVGESIKNVFINFENKTSTISRR